MFSANTGVVLDGWRGVGALSGLALTGSVGVSGGGGGSDGGGAVPSFEGRRCKGSAGMFLGVLTCRFASRSMASLATDGGDDGLLPELCRVRTALPIAAVVMLAALLLVVALLAVVVPGAAGPDGRCVREPDG